MELSEILLARGLVSAADIEVAINRKKTEGGRLDDNLIALGKIEEDQRDAVMEEAPKAPKSLEETGLPQVSFFSLMLKFMYSEKRETVAELIDAMKLPYSIVKRLLDDAMERQLLQALGVTQSDGSGMGGERYTLTERGRDAAQEAHDRSLYLGPAPVSLSAFQEQILKQRITNESIDLAAIRECFGDLVVPDNFLRKIGPAVNAGRTALLYGPPGNGKSSVATRVASTFKHIIYLPYCFEVEGQIIQVYDASVHLSVIDVEIAATLAQQSSMLRRNELDQRWIACRRPIVVVGGEMTLEMLDLSYSETARFYEAPMHIKALGGTFIIDDFGRQLVSPVALLNRWIVPMESRIDFFKLNTGKSFQLPFDAFLIFSTNLEPDDLMDPAFLRRIPYKIELLEPSREVFHDIFQAVAQSGNLELTDEIFEFVLEQLQVKNDYQLAYYQPKFIVDQVISICEFDGVPAAFSRQFISEALKNLYVHIETE